MNIVVQLDPMTGHVLDFSLVMNTVLDGYFSLNAKFEKRDFRKRNILYLVELKSIETNFVVDNVSSLPQQSVRWSSISTRLTHDK